MYSCARRTIAAYRDVVDVDLDVRRGARVRSGSARGDGGSMSLEVRACALDVGHVLGGDRDRVRETVEHDDRRASEEARERRRHREPQPGTLSIA